MAGSYLHIIYSGTHEEVVDPSGKERRLRIPKGKIPGDIRTPEDMLKTIENLGDAYEAIEELYGMLWAIAIVQSNERDPKALLRWAQANYRTGLDTAFDRDLGFRT